MSFEALKREVQALPAEARRRLMAFMVALEDEEREGYATKLAAKMDDKSPDRWLSAEECERKLGLPSEPK
jgi:hypothetical protein